jgi:hypothetical protein
MKKSLFVFIAFISLSFLSSNESISCQLGWRAAKKFGANDGVAGAVAAVGAESYGKLGAAGGAFLGGPVGATIGGLIGLGVGAY